MSRPLAAFLLAGLVVAGSRATPTFAQDPSDRREPQAGPPLSALTSPTAALRVVLDQVCLPAILDNQPIGPLAEGRSMQSVPPRTTRSSQAVAAWRLASWHEIFVMQLPNGGCSLSLEEGDPEGLAALAVTMLQARATFVQGQSAPSADGNATNTAWCTTEAYRPVVAGIVQRRQGRRVALLMNVFRAQAARPPFCAPPR